MVNNTANPQKSVKDDKEKETKEGQLLRMCDSYNCLPTKYLGLSSYQGPCELT